MVVAEQEAIAMSDPLLGLDDRSVDAGPGVVQWGEEDLVVLRLHYGVLWLDA